MGGALYMIKLDPCSVTFFLAPETTLYAVRFDGGEMKRQIN